MDRLNSQENRFNVVRHGGRATDSRRILLASDDKAWAQGRYGKMAEQFRQGALHLQEDDKVHCAMHATTLRTRW